MLLALAGNLHRDNPVSLLGGCRALSNITCKADTPLHIKVRYKKRHGCIKTSNNSTVADLRKKIMHLTDIHPDYQCLTPGGGHARLRGNECDDQRILSEVFEKKKVVDLSESSPVTSRLSPNSGTKSVAYVSTVAETKGM